MGAELGGPRSAAPCGEPRLPGAAHVDPAEQAAFLRNHYLCGETGFVHQGGGKIKLVVGATGSGKTHFLGALLAAAESEGFLTAYVDARRSPLGGFELLYPALVADLDFDGLARRFAARALAARGYPGGAPPVGEGLAEWAGRQGYEVAPLRRALGEEMHLRLLANPDLDYGYALGLQRWCETVLWADEAPGVGAAWTGGAPEPAVEPGRLEHWLRGGRLSARECNLLQVRRPLQRASARLWLRSLLYFIRMAGAPGLVAAVDGLDVLVAPRGRASAPDPAPDPDAASAPPAMPPRYTKQRRDDFYESLRALIDDMSLMPGLLLACAGSPELVRHAGTGFQSYPALAQRLQNEVETVELNRFADEIVLERLWTADAEAGRALAQRLVNAVAPAADDALRQQALQVARAEWTMRAPEVSAVRRTVMAVLAMAARDAAPVPGAEAPAGRAQGGEVPR